MSTEEATINPDGSASFGNNDPEFKDSTYSESYGNTTFEEPGAEDLNRVDPVIYLFLGVFLISIVGIIIYYKQKKSRDNEEDFFEKLDGEKFNLKLPAAVEEYYTLKAKVIESGWVPDERPSGQADASKGPQRVLAQALMKRCMADIPLVTHIQKESAGMHKLYSQSMCSVKQWRTYQAAENMVSSEVEEVRAEADEIEPGWSQSIWKQAMQYHNMLKQRHEMEAKKLVAQAEKRKAEENKILAAKRKEDEKKARELAAEKAAEELIKAEERERQSKSSFNSGTLKKGFLNNKKK